MHLTGHMVYAHENNLRRKSWPRGEKKKDKTFPGETPNFKSSGYLQYNLTSTSISREKKVVINIT